MATDDDIPIDEIAFFPFDVRGLANGEEPDRRHLAAGAEGRRAWV